MPTPPAEHNPWMDAFFASYFGHRPVNATFVGEDGHDHLLPDFSEECVGDLLGEGRALLERAEPEEGLQAAERLDQRLARGFLKIQEWELTSTHFHRGNPSLYTGEAVFGVMGLFLNRGGPLPERVEAATARMAAVPAFLTQARANVPRAPAPWTQRAVRECDGALALFTDGVARLALGQGCDVPAFHAAAEEAARAFARHRAHLETEVPDAGDAYAAGAEALDLHIREGHFLSESAAEIEGYALDQMAEARAYLQAHAADFQAASPEEALLGLEEIHPGEEDYYPRYGEVWEEVRRVAEARDLLTWPDFPIRYVPRPEWTRSAAPYLYFLFYRSPAARGRPPVHDYMVAPLDPGWSEEETRAFLRRNNDSVIKLNHVVHHGGLGHHVQNWHAFRAESRVGRMAAVDCASRIAMFCGGSMAEGWACYATDLAGEAGALTPLEQYAEVHSRIRMAARAVVDVRLHQGRMTLEDAAAFYRREAGMGEAGAWGEAVKNSMFPGAALMYLMGTDAIHALRREMMRRQGPDFELRRFHDSFLSFGSVPVTLVAESMLQEVDRAE